MLLGDKTYLCPKGTGAHEGLISSLYVLSLHAAPEPLPTPSGFDCGFNRSMSMEVFRPWTCDWKDGNSGLQQGRADFGSCTVDGQVTCYLYPCVTVHSPCTATIPTHPQVFENFWKTTHRSMKNALCIPFKFSICHGPTYLSGLLLV